MSQTFYPPLSALISLDDFPEFLGFLKESVGAELDRTFFKDLQFSRNRKGGRSFYSLTLVRYDKIGFTIPGTDIEITFNRDVGEGTTEIPVTLSYEWGIVDLVQNFSFEDFLGDAKAVLGLLAESVRVDMKQIVRETIDNIEGDLDSLVTKVETALPVPVDLSGIVSLDDKIDELIAQIEDAAEIPVLEFLYGLYIKGKGLSFEEELKIVEQWFQSFFGGKSVVEYIKDLLIPKIDASLKIDVGITFPKSILRPVVKEGDKYIIQDADYVLNVAEALLTFSTERGIGFGFSFTGNDIPLVAIGNTGLIMEFQDIEVDLSSTTNIAAATADGRGPEFVGVFVKEATIVLPSFWTKKEGDQAEIKARNVLIGTGGLSGAFSLEPVGGNHLLETNFGAREASPLEPGHPGFEITLDRFDIRFHQGAIVGSNITGTLTIPGLKLDNGEQAVIDISISIDENGFRVGATLDDPEDTITIGIENVFTFAFRSIGIGQQEGRWFLELAGTLNVIAEVPVVGRFIKEPIDIQKMVIWSNGEFDFQGGSLVLPKITPLKIGPVELSVTAVHFGRDEQGGRRYKYIGFDGGVKTGAGGVDARGEGIKYYFSVDDDIPNGKLPDRFLRIETIRIDLRIPGDATPENAALLLSGYVSMKNPEPGDTRRLTEYAGGIKFSMPQLEFAGGAEMRMIPSIGAFYVDANLEMSTPILLGTTGLGIYGFRGLFGKKYVLKKEEGETWWEIYKRPQVGINAPKFKVGEGFSVGAGASIGTAFDSGFTFSSKLFFMITVPTAFFLEGQAAVLSKRIGLDTTSDPPFFAMLSIDPAEGIMAGLSAHMKIPQSSGDVLTLDASVEMAFLFGNSSGWYINLGKDSPDSQRMRATILRILDGWAYFMLASSGIKMGAGVEWKFEQDCGIAKVGLGASLEVGGRLNFKPVQVGGWIILQGYAELRVFGIGFRLSVRASLAAEAPKPFIISGSFELSLSTPWPLPDIDISVSLSWHFDDTHDRSEIGIIEWPTTELIGVDPYLQEVKLPVRATHMLTGESFPVNTLRVAPGQVNRTSPVAISEPSGTNQDIAGLPLPPATNDANWLGTFDRFVVPLDAYIDVEFAKPIAPRDKYISMKQLGALQDGAINDEYVPPQRGVSDQVHHTYTVDDVTVFYLPGPGDRSDWQKMEFTAANTPLISMIAKELEPTLGTEEAYETAREQLAANLKLGFWQLTQAKSFTKLRLLSRTPLSLSGGKALNERGFAPTVLRCPPAPLEKTCQDWRTAPPRTYAAGVKEPDRRLRILVHDDDPANGPAAAVAAQSIVSGYPQALRFQSDQQLEILFPQPVNKVDLLLTTLSERVVVSYYSGYAQGPQPVELSETGRPVDQWNVAPSRGGTAATQDDTWDRLRAIPSIVRAFCSGGTPPNSSLPPVSALATIMSKKFYKTNLYLRQQWAMPAPAVNATFCPRLREMLEVVTIGITGKDRLSRLLKQNVDNFYRDAKRNAESYIRTLAQSGTAIPEPPAAQNAFYEKWLDLIACIGKVYEIRTTSLAAPIRNALGEVDVEVGRLYNRAKVEAGLAGFVLNQPADTEDLMMQLKLIAGFFTVLCLDLNTTDIPTALIDRLEPYFERLDPIVARLRTALGNANLGTCASTSAAAIPSGNGTAGMPVRTSTSCTRLKSLYSIVRLLTAPSAPLLNTATTPIINSIMSLIGGFNATVNQIETLLGWGTTSASGTLALDLARAVRVLAVAWSVIDEMPGSVRTAANTFYGKLEVLAAQYAAEVEDLDAPLPDEDLDEYVMGWIEALICLCNLCAKVETFSSQTEKDYFHDEIDPKIDALYAAVLGETVTAGESVYGTKLPTDTAVLTQWAIWLMTTITTNPDAFTTGMQTWLTTELAAFQQDYGDPVQMTTRFLQGAIYPYSPIICDAGTTDPTCSTWVDILDCLYQLIKRRAHVPATIIDQIVDDFDQLLMDLSGGFMVAYNDFPSWPAVDTAIENVEFTVTFMLRHIYDDCLQGNPVNPMLGGNLDPLDVAELQTKYNTLRTALNSLSSLQRIDLCATSRLGPSKRQKRLVDSFRRMYNDPQSGHDLDSPPLEDLVKALDQGDKLMDEIAIALNLEEVPSDWDRDDFDANFAKAIRLLVMAYGSPERITPSIEKRMNELEDDIHEYTSDWSTNSAPATTLHTTCDTFLEMLLCIANVHRYRDFLPEDVFTGIVNTVESRLESHLIALARKAMEWSEALGFPAAPGRSTTDRCRKLRVITNYFGSYLGNYTEIEEAKELFDDHTALLPTVTRPTTGIPTALDISCPLPPDGSYDPLKKRVRLNRNQLGTAVEYGTQPDEPAIDRIVIAPVGACDGDVPCATYLLKVCWLTEQESGYNDNLPDGELVLEENNSMIYCLNKVTQPLWRPNTRYAIRFTLTEWIGNVNDRQGYRSMRFIGFRTAGPLGHFHAGGLEGGGTFEHPTYTKLKNEKKEETFQYTGLKQYIDYQRSYPNPDGNIIGAKPLYYEGSKFLLFYVKDYMNSMFGQWDGYNQLKSVNTGLKFIIRDPGLAPDAPSIVIDPVWKKDVLPPVSPDVRTFDYIMENAGEDCVSFVPVERLDNTPPAENVELPFELELIPSKLYTTTINAKLQIGEDPLTEQQVHKFVFQTSRYRNFQEHIESYLLDKENDPTRKAKYVIDVDPADAAMAYAVLKDERPTDPTEAERYDDLMMQYGDRTERILDGALQLGRMERPVTTEFAVLTKTVDTTVTVLAVLLRSPEPFNDPKQPVEQLEQGLASSVGGVKKLFAKDATRILVTAPNFTHPTGEVTFTFTYRLFDGEDYAVARMVRRTTGDPEVWEEVNVPQVTATIVI